MGLPLLPILANLFMKDLDDRATEFTILKQTK